MMRIEQIPAGTKATIEQVTAWNDGYARAPWSEVHELADTAKYLNSFGDEAQGDLILGVYQDDDVEDAVQAHVRKRNLNDAAQLQTLLADEFTGEHAFYRATNPNQIVAALQGGGVMAWLANFHGNDSVWLREENRPRIAVFPAVIDTIFSMTKADTVGLMSHPATKVSEKVMSPEFLERFTVDRTDYPVSPDGQAEGRSDPDHPIAYLSLFVVTRSAELDLAV